MGKDFLLYYGKAVFVDDAAITEKAFGVMPMLRDLYNEQTGNILGIFLLTDATAEFYGTTGMMESFTL